MTSQSQLLCMDASIGEETKWCQNSAERGESVLFFHSANSQHMLAQETLFSGDFYTAEMD